MSLFSFALKGAKKEIGAGLVREIQGSVGMVALRRVVTLKGEVTAVSFLLVVVAVLEDEVEEVMQLAEREAMLVSA